MDETARQGPAPKSRPTWERRAPTGARVPGEDKASTSGRVLPRASVNAPSEARRLNGRDRAARPGPEVTSDLGTQGSDRSPSTRGGQSKHCLEREARRQLEERRGARDLEHVLVAVEVARLAQERTVQAADPHAQRQPGVP